MFFKNTLLKNVALGVTLLSGVAGFSQNAVDVNLDVKHSVGGVDTFERAKYINIHASLGEQDWYDGLIPNFTDDLLDDFLNGYDVYLGRDTGGITWYLNNQVTEDPTRSGFANPSSVANVGNSFKSNYANNSIPAHAYESREDLMILAAQLHPFYPDGQQVAQGWAFSQADTPSEPFGTATGEYFARWMQEAYGTGGNTGARKPLLIEVINEPLWHLSDIPVGINEDIIDNTFKLHNSVADEIRKLHNDAGLKISGFCTAFPDFETNIDYAYRDNANLHDFSRWEGRWKKFMDVSGDKMDMWSIHIYDFPAFGGQKRYRKGSNVEATLDMMEHYSYLKFGVAKPFLISEYGAQVHDYFGAWSPFRDYLHVKSINALMMQFMERSDRIESALNFLPIKAAWGTTALDNVYPHRLMRLSNEPASLSGEWIYSDMIHTFEIWKDVNGTRVDSQSSNPDVLTDVFVNNNKAYVVLTNLDLNDLDVDLNIFGTSNNITTVNIKDYHLNSAGTAGEITTSSGAAPSSVTLKAEGTIVLEYVFDAPVTIDETSSEVKYYAHVDDVTTNDIKRPIVKDQVETYTINGISVGTHGEAILRVGVGRKHGFSLEPTITVNGNAIPLPENQKGGNQEDRPTFFGVLEIPVAYNLLQNGANTVTVTFDDASGGHISSLSLQTFEFSKQINRSTSATSVSVAPTPITIGVTQERQLTYEILPANAVDKSVTWSSDNPAVSVDINGKITGQSVGSANITVTTNDGGHTDMAAVTVVASIQDIPVESIAITSPVDEVEKNATLQLSAEVLPVDADDKSITWSSDDNTIATVNSNTGLVTGQSSGTVTIRATANDGSGVFATKDIEVTEEAFLLLDNENKYLTTVYEIGQPMNVTVNFSAGGGNTIGTQGIKLYLRHMKPDWSVWEDYTVDVTSVAGQQSGTVTGSIDLSQLQYTSDELTAAGHFYFLYGTFLNDKGETTAINEDELGRGRGTYPIQVTKSLSTEDVDQSTAVVYPNPTSDFINITDNIEYKSINVYAYNGAKIISKELDGSKIDIRNLAPGIYFIELLGQKGETVSRHKILKE